MWRIRRQIIILMVPIIFVGLLAYQIFKSYQTVPTCFDGIKNQNEIGIDCGGKCISCQLAKAEDLQVVWTRIIKSREDYYDVVIRIKNPNIYFGARSIGYEMVLRDKDDALIGRKENYTFILPNEQFTILETDIYTPHIPGRVELKFKPFAWEREFVREQPYDIGFLKREHIVRETPQKFKQSVVKTSIFNNTHKDFSAVYATVFIYGKDRNIIAANQTLVENLASGETRHIEFSWPEVIPESIESIEGEARVNKYEYD